MIRLANFFIFVVFIFLSVVLFTMSPVFTYSCHQSGIDRPVFSCFKFASPTRSHICVCDSFLIRQWLLCFVGLYWVNIKFCTLDVQYLRESDLW